MKTSAFTLSEFSEIIAKEHIAFVLTRFNRKDKGDPDDLDILVKPVDFRKAVETLVKYGHKALSHDQVLGGRIAGMQVNLVKPGRIKIDLHQDFTWRKSRYFDLGLIWNSAKNIKVGNAIIPVPRIDIDAFLVMINVIFEKTYLTQEEVDIFWHYKEKVFTNPVFYQQAVKYEWASTFLRFQEWARNQDRPRKFPLFLPLFFVLGSYLEKFDLTSLLYYCFFRVRFLLNGKLPYD